MADILQEYLIALGFKVDEASYKKFKASVANGTKEVAGLGAVSVSTATAIALSVEKVAREFEGLYYQQQRTGESVNRLKSYSFAMRQIGVDAATSEAALDSFTTAQRLNPGVKGFVNLLGGSGSSPVEQMTNFVERQKKLYGDAGYYVAAMNAELAGIPEATFLRIWNNLPKLRAANKEIERMRAEAGVSSKDFTDKSVEFMNAWEHMLASIGIGKERIASDLIDPVMKGVKAIDEIVQGFNRADVASKGWLGTIVGVTAALGGTSAALALILRLLGLGGLTGAGAGLVGRGALTLIGGTTGAAAIAGYYGLGLNGQTAGKEDDEPLSKEYRAKHGGGSKQDLKQATIDYFVGQGWSRAVATGIAANLSKESSFDHTAVGDGGKAYGLAQWHPDRQAAFKAWSGKDIRQSSMQEQLGFVQYELTQGADVQARRAGEKLRTEKDPYNAGVIFSGLYERPADTYGEAHARGNKAAEWYNAAPLTPASSATSVTINQTNNIKAQGPDPSSTSSEIANAQGRLNGDLVRNFQGAVR